jgi:hypothetical protein
MTTREKLIRDVLDLPESELVPGLGFNGLLGEIGSFLRKLFKRTTPKPL